MNARPLNQRITPKQFMKVVVDMPETHVKAIREIGFGGLLELDLDIHKSNFSDELVRSFDPDRVSLIMDKNQEIEITPLDIHLVYGLPLGGQIIEEPLQELDDSWKEFLKTWRQLFGVKNGSPSNGMVIAEIERLKKEPVCDNFILHFLICAVNCCIRSTANTCLNYKFLYSCMDTSRIKYLNWCKFAYRNLITSTVEWQDGSAFFTGPLPFLMICYFDRLQRSKVERPRQLPLTAIWKKDMIRERMKVEQKRGFGKGVVLGRVQAMDESCFKSENDMMEFINKFGSLAKSLAKNIHELYSMIGTAKEVFHEQETSEQFSNLIQSIWYKYTTINGAEAQNNPSVLSQDQHVFDEPSFIKELDNVMTVAWERCNGKKITPCNLEKSTKVNVTIYKKNVVDDITPPSFELISQTPPDVRHTRSKANDFEKTPLCSKEAATMVELYSNNSLSDHDGVHGLEDKPEEQGRPKRNIENLSLYLRSPFMATNDILFKKVDAQQKRMAEYAFVDGLHRELLYDDGLNVIYRNDMWSLAGSNHVLNNIIDAWAFLLNVENKRRSLQSINRFFFTTKPIDLLCNDTHFEERLSLEERQQSMFNRMKDEMKHAEVNNLEKFDLVFFPVVNSGNYYILCINFITGALDLIDSTLLDNKITFRQKYKGHPRSLIKAFAIFYAKNNNDVVDQVCNYKTKTLKMKWRTNDNNDDCGIYLLKHMETYYGETDKHWDIGLQCNNVEQMKKLRVEYCGKIMAHKENKQHHIMNAQSKKWAAHHKK